MNAHRCISRKHAIVALAALVMGLALALVAVRPAIALAADGSSSSASSSGSSSASAQSPADASSADSLGGLPMMGHDYVWFGNELKMSNAMVENDLIAAGQSIHATDVMVSGDMRLAAEDITIKDSYAGENITAAGKSVTVRDGDARAVVLAGQTVSFSGSCEELSAYAETVFIDGVVDGDVVVGATTVEIGSNARIKGTLHVSAQNEPVMQRGSEVGDVEYTKVEGSSRADVDGAIAAFTATFSIFAIIFGIIGTFVTALLAEWLFRRQTAGAAEMVRTRTGATIATGVVSAFIAPVVVIILFCLGVTWPVATGLIFALLAMTMVATGFMGASVFKLAFPKLGRFKCAMIGGAIMGVAGAIPFLGAIVGAAAFMYLLGYVLQSIFLGMRDPEAPAPNAQAVPGAPVNPVAPNAPFAQNAAPMQGVQPMQNAAPVQNVAPAQGVSPMTTAPAPQQAPYGQVPPTNGPTAQ